MHKSYLTIQQLT